MIGLLVSVRNVDEARIAAACGVDYLDLKDPAAGALGGLPPATIAEIVAAVRAVRPQLKISATIGDLPADELDRIDEAVAAVAACGVDFVKVGVPGQGGEAAQALLQRLGASAHPIVPVLLADDGIDHTLFRAVCALRFPALMADTQEKRGGSLLDRLPAAALTRLLDIARRSGKPLGFAGALRLDEVPQLRALRPAFAGFRSAVCAGVRSSALDVAKLRILRAALSGASTASSPVAAELDAVVESEDKLHALGRELRSKFWRLRPDP